MVLRRELQRRALLATTAMLLATLAGQMVGCRSPERPAGLDPSVRTVIEPPDAEADVTPPPATMLAELTPQPAPAVHTPPPLAAASRTASSPSRPPHVAGKLAVRLKRDWQYILIHHSGTPSGNEAIFDRYHREHNGWRGVGYDFVIGNGHGSADGLVEVTFRWEQQLVGAHAGHRLYNQKSIGICVVGDLERKHMTPKQMEALVGLVNYLQKRCKIPTDKILLHRHVRPGGTTCPGRNFPFYEFISQLEH